MTDIVDIESYLNALQLLKKEQHKVNEQIKSHTDRIKAYMTIEKKKSLKIGKYSLTLQDREILRYDTKLLRRMIKDGSLPEEVILGRMERQVLTITKQEDIELVGNKFVVRRKNG